MMSMCFFVLVFSKIVQDPFAPLDKLYRMEKVKQL